MTVMSPKEESEYLMNDILPLAERMLSEEGEFHPYGGYICTDGAVVHVAVSLETTKGTEYVQAMIDDFLDRANQGQLRAVAMVTNVRIQPPGAPEKQDAIQVSLEHASGYWADVFFPYELSGDEITFSPVFAQARQPVVFPNN